MPEKVTGYILLVTGVAVIVVSTFSVYQVFTKKVQPVKLFNFKGIRLDPSQLINQDFTQNLPTNLPPEALELLNQQNRPLTKSTEIISADLINDSSNIFAHLFLMGFIASAGFKLASLGVMLARPIVVKLRAKEVTTEKTG